MITLQDCGFFSFGKSELRANQDALLPPIAVKGGYLFGIADGVGSYIGAEQASEMAIRTLSRLQLPEGEEGYGRLFEQIKLAVSSISSRDDAFSEAATTLTFCHITSSEVRIGHVGDCRVYVKKAGKLEQVTNDHTQHQKLLEQKIYTRSELKTMSVKNTLTTAISKAIPLESQTIIFPIDDLINEYGELHIFVMSDGAHHFWEKRPRFSDNTLSNPNSYVASLLKRVRRTGPIDDYSCIALKFLINDN
ncbi:protein phosphatase [Pantoea graminicola]|uniref:PP2C family protein-serine/threonine phosphatase n=1 Tax=Pantoea sp. ARC607 TaxID=2027922 RepID=UPI000DA787DC|nr:protein phosphatase 2C domain-containing protein [Pantoea sp. ARC607]PZL93172.1 protein phosphatase [Pantoea sp. ARC607]